MPSAASLAWSSAYLDRTLARVAHDDGQDFALLGRELRKCRQHLEAVLHNDTRPERGTPCPDCTNDDDGLGPRLRREYAHYCDQEDCTRINHEDNAADVWRCPKNRDHWWSHRDYEDRLEERRTA